MARLRSNFRRWEHLAWVKKEIGFSMLRVYIPAESPINKLPEKEISLIKQTFSIALKKHREYPQLGDLKISVEAIGKESLKRLKGRPFELINPCLLISDLVTAEGRKTPDFFLYSLLSKFKYKEAIVTPWSITAKSKGQIFVLIINQESVFLNHKLEDFKICINGIYGDYKLTTYKCDLDFIHNDVSVKDTNILRHLTSDDFESLNKMYEPHVTFEIMSFQNHGEIKTRLMGNSCQLFVLTPVKN